jgi:DNA invertase Pin-like site-specific DNA recombinase
VLATAVRATEPGDFDDPLFLVEDPNKPAPVWIQRSETRRRGSRLAPDEAVIGYFVRGDDDARDVADIESACRASGWRLLQVVRDQEGSRARERPGLTYARNEIGAGRARGLVVSDLQRLMRSFVDVGGLLEWLRDADATLIALDLDLDTGTTRGSDLASSLITLSAWERERIAEGTRRGVARAKAEGRSSGPASVRDQPELVTRISDLRRRGMTLQSIADQLNEDGIPTLRGGKMWRPSSVQAALGYHRPASRSEADSSSSRAPASTSAQRSSRDSPPAGR